MAGAICLSVSSATAQYYDSAPGQVVGKRPLQQLPPIVTSDQLKPAGGAAKGLFLPPDVGNLPPIVSPNAAQKKPFIFQPAGTPRSSSPLPPGPLSPQGLPATSLPPITKAPGTFSLPPITQPASSGFRATPAVTTVPRPNSFVSPPVPTAKTPSAIQGSGTRSVPSFQDGSGTRSLPSEVFDSLAPATAGSPVPSVPNVEFEAPTVIESGNVPAPGSSTRVPLPAGSLPGTNNFFAQPQSQGVAVDSGCSSCQGGCYNPATVQQQNGCCGSVSNAGYYGFLDAIFWTRGDGDVQLSNNFGLNDFNFVAGGRLTIGSRENSTSGRELTYFGIGNLDETETVTSAGSTLQPLFFTGGGIGTADITAFTDASSQTQSKETQIHSLELNRVRWGWDVLKTLWGIRYIYIDDSYEFSSTSSLGDGGVFGPTPLPNPVTGLFVQDSVNNLFGVHGGFELFYDIGFRTSASFQTKFGGYVNAAKVDTRLFNAGAQLLDQEQEEAAFASTIEFNLMSHVQLSPRSRFRFGYDIFLAWGIFTVENNVPRAASPVLTPLSGTTLNTNNEPLVFHGPSFGFEIFR